MRSEKRLSFKRVHQTTLHVVSLSRTSGKTAHMWDQDGHRFFRINRYPEGPGVTSEFNVYEASRIMLRIRFADDE